MGKLNNGMKYLRRIEDIDMAKLKGGNPLVMREKETVAVSDCSYCKCTCFEASVAGFQLGMFPCVKTGQL